MKLLFNPFNYFPFYINLMVWLIYLINFPLKKDKMQNKKLIYLSFLAWQTDSRIFKWRTTWPPDYLIF